jgi:hypothetical protein
MGGIVLLCVSTASVQDKDYHSNGQHDRSITCTEVFHEIRKCDILSQNESTPVNMKNYPTLDRRDEHIRKE